MALLGRVVGGVEALAVLGVKPWMSSIQPIVGQW
jgi:hypothetical protein